MADLKTKGMQINKLASSETARMGDKLTKINALVATNVVVELWQETQADLAKRRGK